MISRTKRAQRPSTFAIDGTEYEIDLTQEHREELFTSWSSLRPGRSRDLEARTSPRSRARRKPSSSRQPRPTTQPRSATGLVENGYEVNERGRIPRRDRGRVQRAS